MGLSGGLGMFIKRRYATRLIGLRRVRGLKPTATIVQSLRDRKKPTATVIKSRRDQRIPSVSKRKQFPVAERLLMVAVGFNPRNTEPKSNRVA